MKKKFSYNIVYYPLYIWMKLHALLPFCVLYLLSDLLYLLVYYVVGYRKKVVRMNLKNSFPEESDKERLKTEKKFYRHFCDYLVESIKLLHMSEKQVEKRIKFNNVALVKDLMKDGNSCLMYLGHYGNWEWVPTLTRHFQDGELLVQIYRKLDNKAVDDIFLKLRSQFGSFGIEKDKTLREIIRLKKEGKKVLIGFMSDQTPSSRNIYYWTNFLNQDTPIYIGVERIAKQTGYTIAYIDMKKIKRGYYECDIKLISDNPKEEKEFAITERYIREMEKTILREPAYWLWTHKRWKYTREMVEELNRR